MIAHKNIQWRRYFGLCFRDTLRKSQMPLNKKSSANTEMCMAKLTNFAVFVVQISEILKQK